MAHAQRITFAEYRSRFATEADCREYLFQIRFPEGFVCPKCGCTEYYPIRTRHICQCKNCRKQTSVTAGTVMHRTHLPLTVWFWAIYLCATDKRGISAVALSGQLCISYESAWYLLKRIRSAIGDRDQNYQLSGLVEMDEAYLGGPRHGGKRGRGTEQPKMAVAMSKTKSGKPLYLHLQMIPDVKTTTLQSFVDTHLKPGATVECDGYQSYHGLKNVECTAKKFTTGDLKWLHTAISNFKAFLLGTYHGRCQDYQLYLNEFCFRFNRRGMRSELFSRLTRAVATSCALLS